MKPDRKISVLVWLLAFAVLVTLGLSLAGFSRDRSINGKLEELNKQLSESRQENVLLREEISQVRSRLEDVNLNARTLQSLLDSSSEEFTAALRSGLSRNERLIEEKELTLDRIQEELENFQGKVDGLDAKYLDAIDALREETANFRKIAEERSGDMETLSASMENLRTLHANLKSELEETMSHVRPSREMRKLIEEHHIKLAELQDDFRKKSDAFNREMTRLEGDIKELRIEISRLASMQSGN